MPRHYTPVALAALDEEIRIAEERHAVALRSLGDDSGSSETWHDNPAFEQAKQDVDTTRNTLQKLRNLRADAEVIASRESRGGVVDIGSTVIVRLHSTGDIDEVASFFIAGHYVAKRPSDDEPFHLATTSPLGEALIGKSEGCVVSYLTPSGKVLEATIIEIS